MGLFSAIGSAIGSVCSAVGSLCSSIGGALMGAVSTLAPVLAPILPYVGPVIQILATLFAGKPEEEKAEEIGMKAEIANKENDVKPEDYDSVGEYLDYLRNDVKLDPDKIENLTPEDKAKYQLTGLGLYVKDIEEKNNVILSSDFLREALTFDKLGYGPKDIANLMTSAKEHGIVDFGQYVDFLKGYLQPGSEVRRKTYHSIKDMVEKHFEETTFDVDEKIDELKDAVPKDV